MSQDDFHEHNMSDFDHDDDASCMEDMAEHRYYEHDMVDHHYDHGDELYTDYTSRSIIDEADHHIIYGTSSTRTNFKATTTRSSYSPTPTARAPSTSRWDNFSDT